MIFAHTTVRHVPERRQGQPFISLLDGELFNCFSLVKNDGFGTGNLFSDLYNPFGTGYLNLVNALGIGNPVAVGPICLVLGNLPQKIVQLLQVIRRKRSRAQHTTELVLSLADTLMGLRLSLPS